MTTFRFSRLFKEANGLGFTDYILNERMNFAKELLDNSQMPITSIGYEAGFKDPSYFARAFKRSQTVRPANTAWHANSGRIPLRNGCRMKKPLKRSKALYKASAVDWVFYAQTKTPLNERRFR